MTSMLGAETGQLETLAAQLRTTAGEIDVVRAQTETTSTTVVAEMQSAFGQAISGISNSMENLRATVQAAQGQLADTTWTGVNATNFHDGYANFNAAMTNFEGAVRTAFDQFNAQMTMVGETVSDFQAQVSLSLVEAKDSSEAMGQAVDLQLQSLEQAMNQGLSFLS